MTTLHCTPAQKQHQEKKTCPLLLLSLSLVSAPPLPASQNSLSHGKSQSFSTIFLLENNEYLVIKSEILQNIFAKLPSYLGNQVEKVGT